MLAEVAPVQTEPADQQEARAGRLLGENGEPDPERVGETVRTAVAAQLGLSDGDVDTASPLVEIGVDSIMTVGLLRQLEKRTGLPLPPTLLWEYPTVSAVAGRIVELLAAPAEDTVVVS